MCIPPLQHHPRIKLNFTEIWTAYFSVFRKWAVEIITDTHYHSHNLTLITIQWGLEIKTWNTEHHPKSELFKVWIWDGSVLEWSVIAKAIAMGWTMPKPNIPNLNKKATILFRIGMVCTKWRPFCQTIPNPNTIPNLNTMDHQNSECLQYLSPTVVLY